MAKKKDKIIEPVRMQTGGTVYTPEEYASSYVDFYAPFSIQVQKAPDPGDDDKDDDPVRPNILTPVGERDEGAPNIFSQVPIGDSKAAYNATYKDVNEYLEEFGKNETYKADTGGFEDYLKRGAESIKKQGLLPAGVVSLTGLPTGALAYGMGKLNREQQLKNANAIAQTGGTGGSMMTINGQTVSRRPGSRTFDGTLVGMSNDQAYRLDEIRRGFIPGTMKETASSRLDEQGVFNRSGKSGIAGGGKDDDYIIDAYGTVHSAGGAQTVGAFQAERARQDFLRSELDKRGLTFTGDFDAASRTFITSYRDQAKGGRGFFQTTARVDDGTYAKDFANSSKIIDNILNGLSGVTGKAKAEEPKAPPPATEPKVPPSGPPSSGDGDSGDGGIGYSPDERPVYYEDDSDEGYQTDPGGGYSDVGGGNQDENEGGGGYDDSGMYDDGYGGGDAYGGVITPGRPQNKASGGRIGMQAGGVAQQPQPAGFVGGPPENFTDGQTVADDQPMSVPEGTFVINAAAVEFAGSDDIKKMLSKAYTKLQKKVDKTIGVAKIPTEDEIDVAVSRGEVIVPPEVAKIIGYDRLEKINNRGKKEVSRRQEAAGGGFLDGKKFADGGEVDLEYEDRIVTDEVRRKMKALVASLPDDVEVESVYYQPGYPAAQRYQDEVARLNETEPFTGSYFSRSQKAVPGTNKRTRVKNPRVNVPQTPTLFNLAILAEEVAHQDAIKYRQEYDPKKHKVDRRTFNKEQDYLEELRAKDFAMSVVGGLFPKADKAIRGTRASYEKDFARHLSLSNNPELVETYLKRYPELNRFIERASIPGQNDVLLVSDDNYYGQGQPRISPDSSFIDAAMREDITAMNEYHASFNYMLDKFKYLAAQLFVDAEKPEYKSGYTASKGK